MSVFPIGLIHFQLNVGKTNAVVIATLSCQNLGVITTANAVFGSHPPISADILAKAFKLNENLVKDLQISSNETKPMKMIIKQALNRSLLCLFWIKFLRFPHTNKDVAYVPISCLLLSILHY